MVIEWERHGNEHKSADDVWFVCLENGVYVAYEGRMALGEYETPQEAKARCVFISKQYDTPKLGDQDE